MKQYNVVALGELLIDFTENGRSAQSNPMMEATLRSVPCNVLAMLHRLGRTTVSIGKIGKPSLYGRLSGGAVGVSSGRDNRDDRSRG